jgi:AI-2 transport protein TqsA
MPEISYDDTELTPSGGRKMQGARALLTVASLFVVIAGLRFAAPLLIPVVSAFFLAVLSYPMMGWLMRKRVPHIAALLITVATIVVILGLMGWAAYGLLKNFASEVPGYVAKLKFLVENFAAWMELKAGVDGAVKAIAEFNLQSLVDLATTQDVMKQLASYAFGTFGAVAIFLGSLVAVLIVLMFTLMEAPGTQNRVELVRRAGGPDLSLLMNSASDVQKYLGVKTLMSAGTGLLAFLWCLLFGLKYPLLWGILAFVFNFIPAVGSTAAAVPAIIEGLVTNGPGCAIGVALGFGAINFCLDSLLQPMLLGRKFGISGLVIVLSVVFWGWMWGPIGMFLAVPLTMMIKVLLENTKEFRWVSAAMAKKKVKRGEVVLETPDVIDDELLGSGAATEPPRRIQPSGSPG